MEKTDKDLLAWRDRNPDAAFRADKLSDLIGALENDIELFGAAGDDLSRLAVYREELKQILTEQQPPATSAE